MTATDAAPSGKLPTDPWGPLRARASEMLRPSLEHAGWKGTVEELARVLEPGPEGKADLAVPMFRWSKTLGKRPDDLAKAIASGITPSPEFPRVSAEGGFVNFHMDLRAFTSTTLRMVLEGKGSYGAGAAKAGSVCVEHTSANPTGPLHIGRSRNTVIGDTLVRVLRAAGWNVVSQFYVDDVGRQAAMLVWIWSKPLSEWPPQIREASHLPGDERPPGLKADHWYGRAYPPTAAYIKEHEEAARSLAELSARMESGAMPKEEYRKVPKEILDGILSSLARMHAAFDEFVWESDFLFDGSVERVAEKVRASSRYRRTDDGAEGVDATDFGLPKEAPLAYFRRADGTYLYPARDLAYHLQKFARFDRVIDVLGEDHKLHAKGVAALLEAAGEKRSAEVLTYGFINLPEGRMTTRGGRVVNLDDVLDEAHERAVQEVRKRREDLPSEEVERIAESVGSGAVRFHILRVQPEKPIVFRWEEALSFEGKSAPFVQYAHARACSILRKAGGSETSPMLVVPSPALEQIPPTLHPKEEALVRTLSQLPGLIARVSESRSVHLLALYAHEVAERFNEFYQELRVLNSEDEVRPFRLALTCAARQVLANTLAVIGVDALERM
ncbi:MAG: arginine--tRNA ligase [Euryarchaeota archaeon]|nr:arginine--tRNA ligase [Euryarchaeota archaeon]MDE2046314.1 arginine--tRNA ligase [Thermoplasmata archaeon]